MIQYADFFKQDSFIGGECYQETRNRIGKDQLRSIKNMRIFPDRIQKSSGYTTFCDTLDIASAHGQSWLTHIETDLYDKSNVAYACYTSTTKSCIVRITKEGTPTTAVWYLPQFNAPSLGWCSVKLGGSANTPEVILFSNNNIHAGWNNQYGIRKLIFTGGAWTLALWSVTTGHKACSMVFYDGRLFTVTDVNSEVSYSLPRTTWISDTADWEVVPVGSGNNKFLFTIGQNLFVMKETSIYRIEWAGDTVGYGSVQVSSQDGCRHLKGWTYILDGKSIMFYDRGVIKVFDGNVVTSITNHENIQEWLRAQEFSDVWMTWDDSENIATVGFYQKKTTFPSNLSFGFEVRMNPEGKWGFSKMEWTHCITYADYVRFSTDTPGSRKLYYGLLSDTFPTSGNPRIDVSFDGITHEGTDFVSSFETRLFDFENVRNNMFPHLRQIHLDIGTGGSSEVTLNLQHKNHLNANWSTLRDIRSVGYRGTIAGVDRPGDFISIRVTDENQTLTNPWSLYSLNGKGILRGQR